MSLLTLLLYTGLSADVLNTNFLFGKIFREQWAQPLPLFKRPCHIVLSFILTVE